MRFFKNLYIHIGLICLFFVPIHILGQGYQITQVIPYLAEDSLKVDLSVENIFQEKILQTLLAGIPLDIGIKLRLLDQEQNEVSQRGFNCKVTYDVWEEHFWLHDYQQNTINFNELEALQTWSKTINNLGLVSQNILLLQDRYIINVEMRIVVLGALENQQLKWWIENSDQTEEDVASRERSTGFRLNLNQLVQMFFSQEKSDETFVITQSSGFFTLSELKFQ